MTNFSFSGSADRIFSFLDFLSVEPTAVALFLSWMMPSVPIGGSFQMLRKIDRADGIVGESQGHSVMRNTLIYAALPESYTILALLGAIRTVL